MNNDEPYRNITYTFHVQSVEDFHRQLQQYADVHEPETPVEDTDLARSMLESIGVRCG